MNFRVPLSDWVVAVNAQNDKILFRFAKTDPLKPWGPIQNLIRVEYYDPKSITYEGGGVYGGFPPEQPQAMDDNVVQPE